MRFGKGLSLASSLSRDRMMGLVMLLPALVIIMGVLVYPLLQNVVVSFRDYNLVFGDKGWNYLDNYRKLLRDAQFIGSLKNTLVFTLSTLAGGMLLGLVMALILNQNIVLRDVLRGLFLIPWITCGVIISLLARYMFNSDVGIVNYVLQRLGIIHTFIPWFARPSTAMFVIIIAVVWAQFPFHMIMYLAALQAIPREIVEAAVMDGAGVLQRFRRITLPFLTNVLLINATLITVWNINIFDIIYALTGGGPAHATETSAVHLYNMAFKEFEVGYASAIGMVWILILGALSFLYLKIMERQTIEY